jgi:hypothetical protein
MHGEVRITVIATGFDKTGAIADAMAGVQKPAAGVLPFQSRASRPTPPPPPGFAKPAEAPKRGGTPPQAPLNPELNEMEIPTFIRRQMD